MVTGTGRAHEKREGNRENRCNIKQVLGLFFCVNNYWERSMTERSYDPEGRHEDSIM